MKNVLVTGASGFIGVWLVNKLIDQNINVYAIVRNKDSDVSKIRDSKLVKYIYCDIKDLSSLYEKISNIQIDTTYHLAWEGVGGEKRADYKIQLENVKGACDCLSLSAKLGCEKFLCAGTISEKIAENIISMETMAENNIYAISKCTAHSMLNVLSRKHNMQLIWMRLANAYGPNNACGNIVNYILDEFGKGNSPALTKGEQPYDLIYVEDLVEAMYLLGEKQVKRDMYYIGSEETLTLKDFVLRIRDVYPGEVDVKLGVRPDDGLIYKEEWFEIKDLKEDTGYFQKFSLEEGIIKTVKESNCYGA